MQKTDSIKLFLEKSTLRDLADLYDHDMEVQVNVAKDGGELIRDGKSVSYTDGIETWKSFRIPFKANTEPEYRDSALKYDLGKHAEGIGLSGWDWNAKKSKWVGFDFDAIVGHSVNHGNKLSQEHLNMIRLKLEALDYVTVRASTGGLGLHVYVFLPAGGVPSATHTEHAALARAILDKMALEADIDLRSTVDVCGAILWIWHRKFSEANGGLALLKQGGRLAEVPANWRDHISVVSGRKGKSTPSFVGDVKTEELFDILSSHRHRTALDEDHKALIRYLADNGYFWDYKCDHNMLTAHTAGFAAAHKALNFKGVFKTISKGADGPGDSNCFAFPMKNGAWVIRRFTPRTQEEDTWGLDDKQYARCYFNRQPDFRLACIAKNGREVKGGGFAFNFFSEAVQAIEALGQTIHMPGKYAGRPCTLRELKDGKICASMTNEAADSSEDWRGWVLQKGGIWERILQKPFATYEEPDSVDHDNIIRNLVSQGSSIAWAINTSGSWIMQPQQNVATYLKSLGMGGDEVAKVMGNSISKYWTIVNKPFREEYPGEREWNRNSAQLKVMPSPNSDSLNFFHWSKILRHLGKSLDENLSVDSWAQANNVTSGEDYLKLWIASLIKFPDQPLPYLFFFGQEDCGKSVFMEALSILIKNGIMQADNALQGNSDHNGELEHSVLCYIEELDLSQNKKILNKLKNYVTAKEMLLHVKYATPHMIPNTTHWVQFGNHMSYCPAFPGDTRIVVLQIGALSANDMIPKQQLLTSLESEAPDFLRSILDLEIPPTPSRLNIPVIKTAAKVALMATNESALEVYISQNCHNVEGHLVSIDEFYNKFLASVELSERPKWKRSDIAKHLPLCYQTGKNTSDGGKRYIVNMTYTGTAEPLPPLKVVDDWIRSYSWLPKKVEVKV